MSDREEPATQLRATAETIWTRANAATAGPWIAYDDENSWSLHVAGAPLQILKAPKHGTPYAEYWPDDPTAAHITAWHPEVAKLVGNLLKAVSGTDPNQAGNGLIWITALAVARALGNDKRGQEPTP